MDSILNAIGHTPLIRLLSIENKFQLNAHLYAKLEFFNPFGSIKDRTALQILIDAQSENLITENRIIEASSGNLGIALAAISNEFGLDAVIVLPENMSKARFKLLKKYGAKIITSKASAGMLGAIEKANEISKEGGYYCDQFNNPSSIKANYLYTAKEIDEALDSKIDAIVCGIGSGGTISGVGKYFKNRNIGTRIYGVEPNVFPHKIQGIGAGFTPSILDFKVIDGVYQASFEDSLSACDLALKLSSVFIGISSGAVLHAGIDIAKMKENDNKNIVLIFADGGERYI